MADITADMIKDLRDKTGAGMMDCKKALAETQGDLEAAIDWLRKKGLAAAAKKAGRVAADGLIAVAVSDQAGAIVEVNSETDFVARSDGFQHFAKTTAQLAHDKGVVNDSLKKESFPGTGETVEAELTRLIATLGENMSLRRATRLTVGKGTVAGYIHNAVAPGVGKIGVLVALESTGDAGKLRELGKQLAMHIAAAAPLSVAQKDLDAAYIEREKKIYAEQAAQSGKPAEIVAKMVEGRLRKYYEEVVLTEQVFVIDGERKISKVLEETAKTLGAPVAITGFVRYQLGEGIEKQETDFAAEVAAMAR